MGWITYQLVCRISSINSSSRCLYDNSRNPLFRWDLSKNRDFCWTFLCSKSALGNLWKPAGWPRCSNLRVRWMLAKKMHRYHKQFPWATWMCWLRKRKKLKWKLPWKLGGFLRKLDWRRDLNLWLLHIIVFGCLCKLAKEKIQKSTLHHDIPKIDTWHMDWKRLLSRKQT